MLYDALHIAGYHRGLIYHVHAVKDYTKAARTFIEKIGESKMGYLIVPK